MISQKKICVIGANSKVVSSITWPENFSLISHKNLFDLDLSIFQVFVVFSWSHASNNENVKICEYLIGKKVVFISSVAVLSLLVREQWNKYPNEKAKLERLYWNFGGSVIRLGACSKEYLCTIPYSSPNAILSAIIDCANDEKQKVVTPIEIIYGKPISLLEKLFHRLSFISSTLVWRVCCELLVKFPLKKRFPLYGYTLDCFNLLVKPLLLGYGAIGSRLNEKDYCSVVVDPRPNEILTHTGFRDTRLGRQIIGLSAFWHGARIISKGDKYFKKVPWFIKRSRPPAGTVFRAVDVIDFKNRLLRLETDCIIEPVLPYTFIFLAMGSFENSRVISEFLKIPIKLSDHSVSMVGYISMRELIKIKFMRRFLFVIWGRQIYRSKGQQFIVEFRPKGADVQSIGENIYNNQTLSIFRKVLSRKSFWELNQAFFNKFGFGIFCKKAEVWVQVVRKDCIKIEQKTIKKKNFSKIPDNILSEVIETFEGIKPLAYVEIFDAQHVSGGEEFFNKINILDFEKMGRVKVVGSPSPKPLSAFHHTWEHIDTVRTKESEALKEILPNVAELNFGKRNLNEKPDEVKSRT